MVLWWGRLGDGSGYSISGCLVFPLLRVEEDGPTVQVVNWAVIVGIPAVIRKQSDDLMELRDCRGRYRSRLLHHEPVHAFGTWRGRQRAGICVEAAALRQEVLGVDLSRESMLCVDADTDRRAEHNLVEQGVGLPVIHIKQHRDNRLLAERVFMHQMQFGVSQPPVNHVFTRSMKMKLL